MAIHNAWWDGSRGEIVFQLDVSGTHCRVTSEVLRDNFGAAMGGRDVLWASFEKHKPEIEELARRLITEGCSEPDGTVLIRAASGK